ncbi:MAG: alkaline phosphatase [Myxococcales bacterium]|nr:alkaline phosphatase [Myxococcales bacterium]
MRRIESWLVFGLICFLWVGGAQADANGPKNIILMIGDGFGFEQAEAGRLLVPGGELVLDDLDPNPGSVNTLNVFGEITDSAAGGTALATGFKTANGNISMAEDDVTVLPTSMQAAQDKGMAVGILSSVYMCDATPGVWLAHAPSRSCSIIIPQQIDACPDVFLGAGEKVAYRRGGKGKKAFDFIADFVENCNYEEVGNAAELAAAQAPNDRLLGIWGGYTLKFTIDRQNDPGINMPTLAEMTAKAIEVLSRDPDGFFLMVEGGAIDWMAHKKDIAGTARDVVAFDAAVAVAYDFAQDDGETALIVTADHETGGLELGDNPNVAFIEGITASTTWMWGQVHREGMDVEDLLETYAGVTDLTQDEKDAIADHGEMGISDALNARARVAWILPTLIPSVAPAKGNHREVDVPVWAFGPGLASLEGNIDNTDIGNLIFDLVEGN